VTGGGECGGVIDGEGGGENDLGGSSIPFAGGGWIVSGSGVGAVGGCSIGLVPLFMTDAKGLERAGVGALGLLILIMSAHLTEGVCLSEAVFEDPVFFGLDLELDGAFDEDITGPLDKAGISSLREGTSSSLSELIMESSPLSGLIAIAAHSSCAKNCEYSWNTDNVTHSNTFSRMLRTEAGLCLWILSARKQRM
jgi:hypothetical protein